ncbi:FAD dependent oxidoreductase [Cooperia oncophora]
MECMVSTGPFDIALKVMNVDGTERQAGECGSYPIWAVINRCIVLCANRKYEEAEALYKEIRASTTTNELYERSVLALGVFIYSKLNRSSDAFRLIDELRKAQDYEDEQVANENGRSAAAEDPLKILARIEAEKRLKFTSSADVVVCGGGIAGTSAAYHLASRGKRVCLFEKDAIGCGGATGVSGGLVTAPVFFQDATQQHLARRSLELYTKLSQLGRFKFTKCGRVYLASTKPNEILLRRMYSRGVLTKNNVELLDDPSEMVARWPFLQTEDIQLALLSREDVALDPVALCQELARQAQAAGAQIFENCGIEEVLLGDERQVYAVNTCNGVVETPIFVDASGIWTGTVLVKSLPYRHVRTASYPCTLGYIQATILPVKRFCNTPIFNDLDGKLMIRATGFKTLCAGFLEDGIGHCSQGCLATWCVASSGTGLGYVRSALEEVAVSLSYARRNRARRFDLRHGVLHTRQRTEHWSELSAMTYSNLYYSHQFHTARNLRMSPIYHQLRDAGAVFGEIMGYERPLWYEKNPKPDRSALFWGQDSLSGKPIWFDEVAAEYEACRERVGLIDMSSFTKFDITGPDVVHFLQYLCSANIDRPVGTTIYTGMQHERGGYVTDCTLSRLTETR